MPIINEYEPIEMNNKSIITACLFLQMIINNCFNLSIGQ